MKHFIGKATVHSVSVSGLKCLLNGVASVLCGFAGIHLHTALLRSTSQSSAVHLGH